MLRLYGNVITSLDADFYRDLNKCKTNDDKIRFLQARSDLILKDAEQIDAAISNRDPATSHRTNRHKNKKYTRPIHGSFSDAKFTDPQATEK